MMLFDKFNKKDKLSGEKIKESPDKKEIDFNNYIEIAKLISNNDEQIAEEIKICINNPTLHYDNYESEYAERGIFESDDVDTIRWIGLVNCLIRNGYACERDWNDELNDFIYFMNNLKYNVTFDKEILNEDGDIAEWCTKLDEILKSQDLCIGGIDINSDSYVMFICNRDKLDKLSRLALNINHRITSASKM